MSAAANAAGYLYFHGIRSTSGPNAQVLRAPGDEARPAAGQSQLVKPARTPRIEYRKRRVYAALPR